VIGGNVAAGIDLALNSLQNYVKGNLIGMLPDGSSMSNGGTGIYVNGDQNEIGGIGDGDGNIIVNNFAGIRTTDQSTQTKIWNNQIGTDGLGADKGNSGAGILIEGSEVEVGANWLDGAADLEDKANEIAFNGGDGVEVSGSTEVLYVSIRGNSLHSNTGLGIDLDGDGATSNDATDLDLGHNKLMNFPEIESALFNSVSADLTLQYALDISTSSASYPLLVDVYLADQGGEGKTWLNSDLWTIGDQGTIREVVLVMPEGIDPAGQTIVATVTDNPLSFQTGSTSEFSPQFVVPEPSWAAMLIYGATFSLILHSRRRGASASTL
jgi:hypothetical protein